MEKPEFFMNNPQELLAILKRGSRGSFAGAGTQLRENLSNAGLLNPGAYTQGLTQLSIAQGQQTAGVESSFLSDVYKQERGAQLDFNIQDYFGEQARKQAQQEAMMQAIMGITGGIGTYFGTQSGGKGIEAILAKLGGD